MHESLIVRSASMKRFHSFTATMDQSQAVRLLGGGSENPRNASSSFPLSFTYHSPIINLSFTYHSPINIKKKQVRRAPGARLSTCGGEWRITGLGKVGLGSL